MIALLSRPLAAAVLAGASCIAHAVGPGPLGDLSGQTVSIGSSFAPGVAFSDIYTFDLASFSSVAGTAVTLELDLPTSPGTEFRITDFAIAFYDAANTLIAQDVATAPDDYTLSLSAMLPAATGYRFVVSGNVTGTLGGSYGGVLAAAPVPEPETWAMLLAGLGLTGWFARRGRQGGAA